MYISCNWLSRHVDLSGVDLYELANRFTLSVAELEGVEEVGQGLDQVVVGLVEEVHAIEGKRIQRTVVDTGPHGVRQIVCGAPNVAAGQRVPVALPGAALGDLTIREAKVGGVESAGMICSERELGISDEHAGIMVIDEAAEPGTPITKLWAVEDTLWELDNKSITHRPDLWGHRGIAREIAALLERELKPMDLALDYTDEAPFEVEVQDLQGCPRYTAVCLDGISVRPAPMWMRLLLHRVGTRPISNVVDVTNFVMLDLGNPLHAFDRRDLIGGRIVVRRAAEGEVFTTLDGQDRHLHVEDLLIADAERGVALAGVMGGLNSEIKDDTTRVVLESANFDASRVRMTSQRLGLRTESSARFEKSLDPHLAETASRAFCKVLMEIEPEVRVTSAFMDVKAPIPEPPVIRLRVDRVHRRLGVEVGEDRIKRILRGLEFGVEPAGEGAFDVTVPSFRATKDIGLEVDLIEEIGRDYGYDNIPPKGPSVELRRPQFNPMKRLERRARAYMSGSAGFDEVLTYSFAFDPLLEKIGAVIEPRMKLANPISAEMPCLRTHLGPNLLGVLAKNTRGFDSVDVYELERVFQPRPDLPDNLPHQPTTMGALTAAILEDDSDAQHFFRLKGVLTGLAAAIGRPPLTLKQGGVDLPWVHPVRQAQVFAGEVLLGYIAEVHPLTLSQLDVRQRAALFEVDAEAWLAVDAAEPGYEPLARFPAVFRDFAVVVDESVRAAAMVEAIHAASPELITDVSLVSLYRGKGVEEGSKSVAWSVTMRHHERTLTDPEVREVEEAIWASLADRVGGAPRA